MLSKVEVAYDVNNDLIVFVLSMWKIVSKYSPDLISGQVSYWTYLSFIFAVHLVPR